MIMNTPISMLFDSISSHSHIYIRYISCTIVINTTKWGGNINQGGGEEKKKKKKNTPARTGAALRVREVRAACPRGSAGGGRS